MRVSLKLSIYTFLIKGGPDRPITIATRLNRTTKNVSSCLTQMVRRGEVEKLGYGRYRAVNRPIVKNPGASAARMVVVRAHRVTAPEPEPIRVPRTAPRIQTLAEMLGA